MYLQLITIFILLFLVVFTAIQFFNILFRGSAPFLSTNQSVIKRILGDLELGAQAQVYELGCGQANLSLALEKKFSDLRIVAVEYSFLPFVLAKAKALIRGSKIKILKQNIFKLKLQDAALIYCYLNVGTMARLEPKIWQECLPGTKIISYRFKFPQSRPEKIITVDEERIYFYTV